MEGTWRKVNCLEADGILAKEVDSLIRNLIRNGQHTYDSLGDKAGVRVIVRYRREIDVVLGIAGRLFDLSDVENTADRLKPDTVGYLSVHAAIRFRVGDAEASEYPPDRFSANCR